jgi:hypothetical protein
MFRIPPQFWDVVLATMQRGHGRAPGAGGFVAEVV